MLYIIFSLAVPTPTVAILTPIENGTLETVVDSLLALNCSILVDSSLIDNVTISVTWLRGAIPISNATDRISISPLDPSDTQSAMFISTLTVYPLVFEDSSEFTCSASIVPLGGVELLIASDYGEDTVTVVVQGESYIVPNKSNTGSL